MSDWRSYFAGRYLSGPVLTEDTTATIAHIESTLVEDPDGGAARERMIVHFRNDALKPWLPCKTTGFCMAAMYGDDTEGWIGKPVTLYFDPTVKVGRDVKGGIRVRGAPGIRPMTVEVKLPKRKPLSIRLVDTAPRRQEQQARPTADLEQVLADAELTVNDLDDWRESNGKGPVADLDDTQRAKLAGWLAQDQIRLEAIRAFANSTTTPDTDSTAPEGEE